MKAEMIRRYGGPDVLKLEEVERPGLRRDEVMIRVRAAGVNPLDWKVREGKLSGSLPFEPPFIPGWDVAGEIDELGSEGLGFGKGDSVYALLRIDQGGGYAEFARAPAAHVALKPESLDFITAASVPLASLTAYQAIEKMGLSRDDRVLIHGAAGGVGGFAVQFAHLKGATVIALGARGDEEYLHGLGADAVHAYDDGPFERKAGSVRAVLDVIGGEILKRSWKVLERDGVIVSTVDTPQSTEARKRRARGERLSVLPDGNQLREIARLIDAGEVKVRVAAVLPLTDAAKAQEIARTGHQRGKVVLEVA